MCCDSYDKDLVFSAITKGIELLGGITSIINPSQKVLLKPNLLNRVSPERCATTHPAVFEAIARLLNEKLYSSVSYGDSPGHPGNIEKTAEVCGIKTAAGLYNLSLGEFSKGKTVEFPQGIIAKSFEICQAVIETDTIINICKMKTHQLERITGAVKNILGCVYGLNKAKMHVKYPDSDSFGKMLIDLNLLLKPRFHVMDGITAMEGNGPMSGDRVQMNCILMSEDPVALDTVFCRLINLDPELVPTNKYGEMYGLGNSKENNIEILGDDIKGLINPKFKVQRDTLEMRTFSMGGIAKNLFSKRPYIVKALCKQCNLCIESCPVDEKAIYYPNNKPKKTPRFNYKKCIRCYCCQELCPEKAILVKTPLLGKLLI